MKLNDEQLAAVQHPVGNPAILLAGAGAGKTASLTARIIHLIDKENVTPKRILALTFTNKAANEIRERVLKALPHVDPADAPRLTTIHALALSMIRRNPPGFGLPKKITPIDDYDQSQLMKRIILREKMEDSNPWKVLEQIEFHRARGLGFAKGYTKEVHDEALRIFNGYHALRPVDVQAWKLFEREKQDGGLIDFSDMLHLCTHRAATDDPWRQQLEKVFDHVILDEAQDTSPCAWNFINSILGKDNPNLLITGDLSQSIYSFNGSRPQLILDYMAGWNGRLPTLYKLVRNHRSVPEIVKMANRIQAGMTDMPPMKMVSYRGEQGENGKTLILQGEDPSSIATKIAQDITSNKAPFKDYCLLIRAGSQLRDIEGALIRARIPYIVRGGKSLLQTEEVRDIMSYVRFAVNTKDFAALVRTMSLVKGVGDAKLEKIRTAAQQYEGDLFQACKDTAITLGSFVDTINRAQSVIGDPVAAIQAIITGTGYVGHVQRKYAKDKDKIETKLDNLLRLKEMVRGLLEESDLTVEDMLFQMTMEKPEKESANGAVTISTIHSAKGLEWRNVYICNVVENSMPSRFSLGDEEAIQEERRVWYVAETRGRDRVTICVPEQMMNGKYMSPCRPSRFLVELGLFPPSRE